MLNFSSVCRRGAWICESSDSARSMGPATSCGKNATNSREIEQIARRRDAAAIHVDHVAHGLERVEGDADREHDAELEGRERDTE